MIDFIIHFLAGVFDEENERIGCLGLVLAMFIAVVTAIPLFLFLAVLENQHFISEGTALPIGSAIFLSIIVVIRARKALRARKEQKQLEDSIKPPVKRRVEKRRIPKR